MERLIPKRCTPSSRALTIHDASLRVSLSLSLQVNGIKVAE